VVCWIWFTVIKNRSGLRVFLGLGYWCFIGVYMGWSFSFYWGGSVGGIGMVRFGRCMYGEADLWF